MTVLVAYASKHGSTEGIAQAIADRLRELGEPVEMDRSARSAASRTFGQLCSGAQCMQGPG